MEAFNTFVIDNAGFLTIVIGLIAVVALALAASNTARMGRLLKNFSFVTNGDQAEGLAALLDAVARNTRHGEDLDSRLQALATETRTHFKKIGLVRYDAFDDVAGQQSYSLCFLDDHQNGVLISSLVGQNFARSYAVEITAGEPARKLGEEEQSALSAAAAG